MIWVFYADNPECVLWWGVVFVMWCDVMWRGVSFSVKQSGPMWSGMCCDVLYMLLGVVGGGMFLK